MNSRIKWILNGEGRGHMLLGNKSVMGLVPLPEPLPIESVWVRLSFLRYLDEGMLGDWIRVSWGY